MKLAFILLVYAAAWIQASWAAESSEERKLKEAAETQELWRYTTSGVCLLLAGTVAWATVNGIQEVQDCKRSARAQGKSAQQVEEECHELSTGGLLTLGGIGLLGLGVWALVDPWEDEDRYKEWKKIHRKETAKLDFYFKPKIADELGVHAGLQLAF